MRGPRKWPSTLAALFLFCLLPFAAPDRKASNSICCSNALASGGEEVSLSVLRESPGKVGRDELGEQVPVPRRKL